MATTSPFRIITTSPTPPPSSPFPPHNKPLFPSFTPRLFLTPFKFSHHHFPFSSSFSSRNGSNTTPPAPETECPVPREQQPINEYQSLSTSLPFSWAAGDAVEYGSWLFALGASFAVLVGLPVAWFGSVGAESEPLKRVLCAASSGVFVATLAVVRMYLGWAYVGNRLLSATVEYEETGWYDGQIWVKTAEVLARDRLLGSFSVKPVLSRLKFTLVSLATSLLVCALMLINIDGDRNGRYLASKEAEVRVVPGIYNDESARSFEPDAFCGEPDLQQ